MTPRARVDEDHLVTELESHDVIPQGCLVVGTTRSSQRGLHLFGADISHRAIPKRNVTPAIDQRKAVNTADLILSERWWDRLLGVSRPAKCDCAGQSEQGLSTSSTKYQVAT